MFSLRLSGASQDDALRQREVQTHSPDSFLKGIARSSSAISAFMETQVVNNIDIGAVREQLLLLGHHVDDATIVQFVRGLNLENETEAGSGQ